jgi:transcriptional regulator with XRE-family HTH domain
MTVGGGPFGARLKALREAAGFTQEELATIAGLSVHAVSALERGERRRPQLETVALAAGDEREADRLVGVATSALQPAGPWFLALGLYIRIILTLRRGDIDEVIALMRKSLTRVRESQDRFTVMYGLVLWPSPRGSTAMMRGWRGSSVPRSSIEAMIKDIDSALG